MNEYYQHRFGGIYIVNDVATHTDTNQRLVIYTHVYPFDEHTWARPIDEWTDDRFKQISYNTVQELMKKDRLEFQIEIGKARGMNRSCN